MSENTLGSDAGSLKRGVVLLKLLATAGTRGRTLTEIAALAGLPHPSVHRVLRQLLQERLVSRNEALRRYRLGPLVYELGMAGASMYDLRELCDDRMRALSEETSDTVYLVVRSGFEAVCMHRIEGSFPIRTLVLDVGSRRPLGVGAGGLALLAALDPDEGEEVLDYVAPRLPEYAKLTRKNIAGACASTRRRGASIIQDTVNLGVSAVGCAFRDGMGRPIGALSVAALSHRMPAQRMARIAELLKDACADIASRIGRHQNSGWETGA